MTLAGAAGRKDDAMVVSSHKKLVWIVKTDYYTGEILDLKIKRLPKDTFIGNTGNGDGTYSVTLYPARGEYRRFHFDRAAVMRHIKDSRHYRQTIESAIYANTLDFGPFFQKLSKAAAT